MKQNFWTIGLLGGLLGVLSFILFFIFLYIAYKNPFFPTKSFDFFVYMVVLLAVVLYLRSKKPRGFADRFHLWEGFRVSLWAWFVMMLGSVTFIYVFMTFIAPETVTEYAAYEINQYVAAKEQWITSFNDDGQDGEKMYEEVYKNYQKRNWVTYLITQEIIQKTFIGILLSLIIAAVIRK